MVWLSSQLEALDMGGTSSDMHGSDRGDVLPATKPLAIMVIKVYELAEVFSVFRGSCPAVKHFR